ncbi:MAG: M23 family metallopeptidase [Desulfuromonadales bacterium]
MRHLFFALLILILLTPSFVLAGEPQLQPATIDSGGVAVLRWPGAPPQKARVRFNDRDFSLWPDENGAFALLGADLGMPPGIYPVTISGIDGKGRDFAASLPLQIRAVERPEERLRLPAEMVTPRTPATIERIGREKKMLTLLFADDSAPPLWNGFIRPVNDPFGSMFGLRRILNGEPRSPHAGIDFRSPRGTPVRASGRGRAILVDDLYFTGRTVVLDHGAGLFSLYAHLDRTFCRTGELLERGAVLGEVGSTGRSTGPHLHWGFKLAGDRIDPLALLAAFPVGKNLDSPPHEGE